MEKQFFKCQHCPKVVLTAQGLKSHTTRLHKYAADGVSRSVNGSAVSTGALSSQTSVKCAAGSAESAGVSSSQTSVKFAAASAGALSSQASTPSEAQAMDKGPSLTSTPSVCMDSGLSLSSVGSSLGSLLANLKLNTRVIRRIPKGARSAAADALSTIIDKCVQLNSVQVWERLLLFTAGCLQVPHNQESRKVSLSTLIKRNISDYCQGRAVVCHSSQAARRAGNSRKHLAKLVEAKMSEGDVAGAVRILCSEDSLAPFNADTRSALLELHPDPVSDQSLPSERVGEVPHCMQVSENEVRGAIASFPAGSAGGLDLLRPQHLKDMISPSAGNAGMRLLSSLSRLCNIMLSGVVPAEICPVIYGASLCALLKKKGGIRPIAVGCTFRRLVAKMGSYRIRPKLSESLSPIQLGFGVKGGAEAAAHAARRFISFDHSEPKVLLKIDFKNAFNTINRDAMLHKVQDQMPELFPFLKQCYQHPSHLAFGEELLWSKRGIQQGDPLGPGLFCLTTYPLASAVSSELNLWYLDDAAVGGSPSSVLKDYIHVSSKAATLGLEVNSVKCELFVFKAQEDVRANIIRSFQDKAINIQLPVESKCTLLGAPLVPEAIKDCLVEKTSALKRISDRLSDIGAHAAFHILKNSQAIPKLSHVLRCSPTWKCGEELAEFDAILREALEVVTNTRLEEDAWEQSALPVDLGGLGIRHATALAKPAFLASVNSVLGLVSKVLPLEVRDQEDVVYSEGVTRWISDSRCDIPTEDLKSLQRSWETPGVVSSRARLLERADTLQNKARLLGVATREAGAFLNALPSPQLGTLLEDDAFRVSIALRLGSKICEPHVCVCGSPVDVLGTHGLNCSKSSGRSSRHSTVNDIIRRGLASANIPTLLEPTHLSLDDNCRPDGMTQIPWTRGRPLVWDFTCTNGLSPCKVAAASIQPLYAASVAEQTKKRKYAHLHQAYNFTPIAVECLGSFGQDSLQVLRSIGRKMSEVTGEKRAAEYFLQRISIAVQRGNAACVLGTLPPGLSLNEYFTFL